MFRAAVAFTVGLGLLLGQSLAPGTLPEPPLMEAHSLLDRGKASEAESTVRQFLESGGAAMRLHTKEELCSVLRLWHSEEQRQAAEVGR